MSRPKIPGRTRPAKYRPQPEGPAKGTIQLDAMKTLSLSQTIFRPWLTAFVISIIYAIVGGVWVFFSEPILAKWIADPARFHTYKIASQWLFIVISAQLLFLLIRHRELAFVSNEESLHRVNRALRVFSECKKAITWDTEEFELLRKICRILVALGGYRLAWVGYPTHGPEKNVQPVAHWGYEEGYLNTLKVTWDESAYGQGPAGTTIRTGQTVIVQNIMNNPKFKPWRDMAMKHGFTSAISLPLHNGNSIYGALVILAAEPGSFDAEEASQLEELADDLANRIRSLHSEAAQRKAKEEQLMLAKVIHQQAEGVLTFDRAARVQYLNPAWEKICGVNAREVLNYSLHELPCCRRNDAFYQAIKRVIDTGEASTGQFLNIRTDGSRYRIEANISPVLAEFSEVVRYVAVIRDVTYESQLEDQLRTAQKMEAIATLAGGIAHDFNNILAAILNNTELALDDLPVGNPLREHLEVVQQAGGRGKGLVKQIMTISRQHIHERRPVNLEFIINECLKLLRATLPSTIEIRRHIVSGLGLVSADPTQMHQVILNICTNAADAMEGQNDGILEVRLEEVTVAAHNEDVHAGLHPGSYLKLSVRDTGHGMDRETLARIFVPFFTTKRRGKGTGLGLSVAHGIIKSHGGLLNVESTPGKGTEFHVYLPKIYCVEDPVEANTGLLRANGKEKILFVDDEPALALSGQKMLEKLGYQVVAATDSLVALQSFLEEPASFDLVITDQTMPHMTGEMLAVEIHKVRDDVPIILCTGNVPTDNPEVALAKARAVGICAFMHKPYERSEMSQQIRHVLDSRSQKASSWPMS